MSGTGQGREVLQGAHGGWDCKDFKPSDIQRPVSPSNLAEVNRTLGCFSKFLIDKLGFNKTQLYDPATMKPVVPPGCVGFSAVYDCGVEPYRTHLLSMLQAVATNLCGSSGGIVIDRQDFLGLVNPRNDDGTTATNQHNHQPPEPTVGSITGTDTTHTPLLPHQQLNPHSPSPSS